LDAIEKAVRNALEKGDATDKNYRRRVYVSARHALEKSMKGKKLTQTAVDDRFSKLTEIAAMIESEFTEAEGEIQYPSPGRRAYEAAPPLLDEENQTTVVAEREFDETFAHSSAEEAFMGGPPEDATEEDVPVSFEEEPAEAVEAEAPKPVKISKAKKKPRAAKKATKKAPVPEAPVPAVNEAVSEPGPDLFEGDGPDWGEVSLESRSDEESELNKRYESLLGEQTDEPKPVEEELREDVAADDEFASGDLARLDGADSGTVEKAAEPEAEKTTEIAEKTMEVPEPEPVVTTDEVVTERHIEVHEAEPAAAEAPVETSYVRPVSKGRYDRGFGFSLMLITCLAVLVMGMWFAISNGALRLRGSTDVADTTVTVAPQDLPEAEKPAAPAGEQTAAQVPAAAPADNWLMIFRPENPGELVVDPTISATVKGSGPLAHLRVEPAKSSTGDAAVVFSLGQGILEQIAGKKAVFDIVAAADDGNPTQISVFCDFAGLGDCGRKRFQIDAATSDNLFQIEFPAGQPTGNGQIVLNPDVEGKGRALEIYAIKVRIAN
jgi:outer membrane biosynthesis protein TonB